MKCVLALVARDVVIAHDTGVPSAFNILAGIQAEGFPLLFQELSFLTVWSKDSEDSDGSEGYLTVTIAEKELLREKVQIDFRGKTIARNVANFQGLVLPSPGVLVFRFELGGVVASYSIDVTASKKVETATTN